MKDEWQDPEFAARWDQTALVGIGNPLRAEQVDILISYIADFYKGRLACICTSIAR
jgi:hypothetical protein